MSSSLREKHDITCGPSSLGVTLLIDEKSESMLPHAENTLSLDVEYDPKTGEFVGLGFYAGGQYVYYYTDITDFLVGYIQSRKIGGHNFKGDLHKLREWGFEINLDNVVFDSRLMSYVIDSASQDHGLKDLAKRLLGIEYPSYEEVTTIKTFKEIVKKTKVVDGKRVKLNPPLLEKKEVKKRVSLKEVPTETAAAYNGMDCIASWRLMELFGRTMDYDQKKYYDSIEFPLMKTLYKMEERGVKIDVPFMRSLDEEFKKKSEDLRKYLFTIAGLEFNPNSPKQVKTVLNKAGIQVQGTDYRKDLLPHKSSPLVKALLEYRKIMKLHTTYTSPLTERGRGGRVCCEFKQSTITGRLASSDPNLQNIPSRGEDGKRIRHGFVAEEGNVLVVVDFSQIDLRCLAHESLEPAWLGGFMSGGDPHQSTANQINRMTGLDISRHQGKTMNFVFVYLSGPGNMVAETGCTLSQAEDSWEVYRKGLPTYFRWTEKIYDKMRRDGYLSTLLGRKVRFPKISSRDEWAQKAAHREGVSLLGQGSAADIVKVAMISLDRLGIPLLIQVHDELVAEVPKEKAEEVRKLMETVMSGCVKMRVPLEVKGGIGRSWGEAK